MAAAVLTEHVWRHFALAQACWRLCQEKPRLYHDVCLSIIKMYVGFLRSGTKLPFSRHSQSSGLSQSHDDLSDAAAANSNKKIGSLPRRLLKHFSLKTKAKPSVNGSAQGGDK